MKKKFLLMLVVLVCLSLCVLFVLCGCNKIDQTGSDVSNIGSGNNGNTPDNENSDESEIKSHRHKFENGVCKICNKKGPSIGLKFQMNEDENSCYVAGLGSCEDTDVVIPSEFNGVSVTKIGSGAFQNCKNITSIDIPVGVTEIKSFAFSGCIELTSITIPDGVTSIGNSAFKKCESLTKVSIPSGVVNIGHSAFAQCENLKHVVIPNSVTKLYTPDNNYGVGKLFDGCEKLVYNEYENGLYIGGEENPYLIFVKAKSTNVTKCTINLNTRFIEAHAFEGCSALTELEIPNGIVSIGDYAFYDCSGVGELVIPTSVQHMGCGLFTGCTWLQRLSIPFVGEWADKSQDDVHYYYSDKLEHLFKVQNIDFFLDRIPESLKTVTLTGDGTVILGDN